jgi:rod shape-determining protein MreC
MRDLLKFLTKNSFFLLFLLLEGISLIFIVQHNSFQKSAFINSSHATTGFLHQNLQVYREYFQLRRINSGLQEENIRLRNILSILAEKDTTALLTAFSGESGKYFYFPAHVINNSVTKQYNYLTLNAGRGQGLSEDMAVVSEKGVVGIITGVSEHFALVLPVLNRNFRISAKIKRNNYFGVAEWDGRSSRYVQLNEISLHVDAFPGDTIVTSGHSAIFPEGIPIGVITEIREGNSNFFNIKVKLLTDFDNLYYVTVIKNQFQEEQLLLENQNSL